jgi:hypothetical protein
MDFEPALLLPALIIATLSAADSGGCCWCEKDKGSQDTREVSDWERNGNEVMMGLMDEGIAKVDSRELSIKGGAQCP